MPEIKNQSSNLVSGGAPTNADLDSALKAVTPQTPSKTPPKTGAERQASAEKDGEGEQAE